MFLKNVGCLSENNALVCLYRYSAFSLGPENARIKMYLGSTLSWLVGGGEIVGLRTYRNPLFGKSVSADLFCE